MKAGIVALIRGVLFQTNDKNFSQVQRSLIVLETLHTYCNDI